MAEVLELEIARLDPGWRLEAHSPRALPPGRLRCLSDGEMHIGHGGQRQPARAMSQPRQEATGKGQTAQV